MIGLALRLKTGVGRLFNALASDLTRSIRRPPVWRLLVLVGSEGFEIFTKRDKAVAHIATIAGNLTPDETRALMRMVASLAVPRDETVIRLSPERVIIKNIVLPETATNYADAIVRNRIERIAPWPAAEAIFGYTVDSGTAAGQIVVKVAVAGRKQLKDVADVLGRIGIDAGRVDVGEDQNSPISIELAANPSGANQVAGRAMAASIAAVLLSLFAIGAGGGYQAYTAWRDLAVTDERIARLQERAIGAGDTVEERAVLTAIEELVGRKVAERPFSSALLELTRAVPDNSWITEINYRRPDITITGKGEQVPPLIGSLESSPGFAEVNFAAPTRRGKRTSRYVLYTRQGITARGAAAMTEARRFPLSRQGAAGAGLLAIALAIAALLAWTPYRWASVLNEELVPRQDLLAALERRSAGSSAKTRADRMKGLLDGPTVGLAAAELQRLVADIAAANEMNVESIQVLAPETTSGVTAVKIEIQMSGSLKGTCGSMYEIEMGIPLLFIEEADLKTQDADSERLDVRLVVEGLFAPKRNEKVGS